MIKSALTVLALVLALPYACAPVYHFADARPFSGDRFYNPYASMDAPAWKRANLHAHGRAWAGVTSARQSDAEVAAAYRANGYDLAVISDYQRIAPPPTSDLPAYEHGYNAGKHHQLGLGARQVAWFDLPLWQGTNQKQYVINQVSAGADLVAICHPAALQGYAYGDDELAKLSGYQLMEVVNGRFSTESSWDAALSAGRPVWVIGDDDTHDVTQPDRFAIAWNMIGAASTSQKEVLDALRAGRSYAVLTTSAAPTQPHLTHVDLTGNVLTVSVDRADAEFTFIGQRGDVKRTTAAGQSASYTLTPDDTYIRTRIKTPTHTLFVNPIVRWDGRALPAPVATIDPTWTWIERLAILGFCALLVASIVRRHTRGVGRARGSRPWRRVATYGVLLAACGSTRARAQETPAPLPGTLVGGTPFQSSYDASALPALPVADNVFTLIETTNVETISDRVSTGGLGFGSAPHLSAFGGSITQTRYRIGDVDVTDPSAGGTPMFLPELNVWQRVVVDTGLPSTTANNPGMTVGLEPRMPTAMWTSSFEGSTSFGSSLTASPAIAPAIASLTGWNRGSAVVSGPLSDTTGILVAGALTHESDSARGSAFDGNNDVASVFAHLVMHTSPTDEVRALAAVQRTLFPATNALLYTDVRPRLADGSVHVQTTWLHGARESGGGSRDSSPDGVRLFGAYTQRDRSPQDVLANTATMERLDDGPPMSVADDTGARTDRRISLGAHLNREHGIHHLEGGAELDFARSTTDPGFTGTVGELVDGMPARLWQFTTLPLTSHRGSNTLALFASDRLAIGDHASLDVGLRFERLTASADGAPQGIAWNTLLPHAMFRSTLSDAHHVDWFAGGGVSAYQLPLDDLAWGDPAAPSINVYRWTGGALAPTAPAILNVGPGGTGRIDPNLSRPYSYDLTFGVDAKPIDHVAVELAGLCRWDRQLFGVINESPNAPRYTTVDVNDPGLDLPNPADDQVLHVSNYVPAGATPYSFDNVLTNPADATARRLGAKLTIEYTGDRLFVTFGAAAYEAQGRAASRGYQSGENDPGLVGEDPLFPNATINDVGRLFGDRAFIGKVAAIYRFPRDWTVGAIARYHDGQPFARLVIVPDLNQGPDIVRAFGDGGSRFTFTATLDVRLQKAFTVQGHRLVAFVDAYNLTNRNDEVEEDVVTGTAFRTPTAFQPPRTVRVGARVEF